MISRIEKDYRPFGHVDKFNILLTGERNFHSAPCSLPFVRSIVFGTLNNFPPVKVQICICDWWVWFVCAICYPVTGRTVPEVLPSSSYLLFHGLLEQKKFSLFCLDFRNLNLLKSNSLRYKLLVTYPLLVFCSCTIA